MQKPKVNNPASSPSMLPEKQLRDHLNVTVHDMKGFRRDRLEKGVDYEWAGNRYEYTTAGVEKTCRILNVPLPDVGESASTQESGPPVLEMRVERICPNPTWVRCRVDGRLVNVRVKQNRSMHIGKKLRVVHDGRDYRALGVNG